MPDSAIRNPHSAMVVLITGASSGIGEELARQLAEKGYLLALAARRVARLEALSHELTEKHGMPPLVLPTDVRRKEDIESMVKKTYDHYGRIDVLVNNAGVLKMQPFLSEPEDEMRDIFETNFWSLIYAVRAVAPIMTKQGGGHVVNVGSGVSRRGLPYMAVYSASKFALAGLTEALRGELRPHGIRFTTVYPGGVETDMPRNVDRAKLPAGYPAHIKGISAARCARAIVRAIRCRPLEVYVPFWVRWAACLSVLFPSVADWVVNNVRMPRGPKRN